MSLAAGTRLGVYEVTAQIGAGGMGAVYRATDTSLGRQVAIKVLPGAFAQDAERLARFEREAKTLAALNHPHIAAIYGFERSSGTQALVMELVEGDDLSQRIAQGPIPLDETLRIARQIADALAAAHDRGIIHRDLKPANIKVRPDGTVKVLDFGLAKATEPGSAQGASAGQTHGSMSPTITTPAMTQAGMILGTAAYMAPEQARGKPLDRRVDIWAFGCVVFEMLTAVRAFDAEDVSLTLSMVLQREPDFAALPSSVPPHVAQTLRVCLRKDPRERPGDACDVRLALDGAFQADAHAAVAPMSTMPTSHRRAPWIAAAAALLLAAVSGYGWWRAARPVELPLMRLSIDLGPDARRAPRETMALSPDGTRIVFVGRGTDPGTRQLYTRRLDEPTATPIAGTVQGPSLSTPAFSPAGDWVAYIVGNSVRKVPVQGGLSFLLAETSSTPVGVSWGDDDNIVIGSTQGLLRVPSSGGAPQRLKTTGSKFMPAVLPGSTAILMASPAGMSTLEDLRIEVFATKTEQTKTLLPAGYASRYVPTSRSSGHLLFIRQRTLYGVPFDPQRLEISGTPAPLLNDLGDSGLISGGGQFSLSNTGTFAYLAEREAETAYPIAWLTPSGTTTPIVAQPSTYGAPRLSPDGSRLAYSAPGSKGADVWVYDLQRNTPTQLTFMGVAPRELAWAPDSKHLVIGDGDALLWIRADGAGEPQRLLEKSFTPRPANFSPDGRLVYSRFGADGLPDIWTLPVDLRDPEHPKPGKAEPFLSAPYVEVDPAFSPDGKFIAYASTESGPNELFVRSFPGPGGKWRVSTNGGKFPAWSPKTPELFFLGGDDRIMVATYTMNGDAFAASVPRPWSPTQILRDGVRQNFDIAADGKRVVMFPRPMEGKQPEGSLHANFLLNFFDEVRRRIP